MGFGDRRFAEVEDAGGEHRARAASTTPATRWSRFPTPPLAITGTLTASAIARVSVRS
jgi:hypothetical protein